jgi:hypothetical protein
VKLLHIATPEDGEYLDSFAKLSVFRGHQVAVARRATIRTSADVAVLMKSVAADAVLCTNETALKLILEAQYDYIPPNTRRGVTLDDYAGSVLTLHAIPGVTKEAELLVLNPPKQLYTVAEAPFVFERFISKLTKPQDWLPALPFQWRLYDPSVEDISSFINVLARCDFIAIDIETAIGDPDRRINCVGYSGYTRSTGAICTGVIPFTSWAAVCAVRAINANSVPKIFQNGLYDNQYFARWNCPVYNYIWDTQHLFHSWLSELPKRLDFVSAFNVRRIRYWKDDGSTGSLADYYRYNALDCWATLSAFLGIMKDIPQWGMDNYLQEFPLVFPCHHCALEGIAVDLPTMAVAKVKAEKKTEEVLTRLRYRIDSPNFNPGSWQQVAQLFKVLGLILPGTGKAEMQKAKASSMFNENILNDVTTYREQTKLNSNYYDTEKIWNGRLYYSLNPAGTDTGRLASKESAYWCGYQIQNISRDNVKQCLVADAGWLLCEIDKAQSEARCVGYLSGEEKLITLVESDKDYHKYNASQFFGVLYELVDKILRDLAKRTNHGANYNMGPDVMLDTMGPKNVLRAKKALRLPLSMRLRDVCAFPQQVQ